MPELVRLYIRQCLAGLALGIVFSMLLVVLNVANLRHLIGEVDGGWLAFALLSLFNGIVFAGVQFGISIIRMGRDDRDQ
jgi:tetrahydromethanopterin S-methyltransferase subunit F